ncbi:Hypothetical protein HVR_LOCUS866 [uncultured virus]|nr:Hypothetical protein HVR_LOCUS866 [uncultured virus]
MFSLYKKLPISQDLEKSQSQQLNHIHRIINQSKKRGYIIIEFFDGVIYDENIIILENEGYNIKCIGGVCDKKRYRVTLDPKVVGRTIIIKLNS